MRNARAIVHVDDDPMFTRLVAAQMSRLGFSVAEFHDAAEFLDALPRRHERLVLLDIAMPGIDGLETLRRIKAFDGGILVIVLTGVVEMTTVLEALRCGAEACFFKPLVDIQPLARAVACSSRKIERWWQTLDELAWRRNLGPDAAEEDLIPRHCESEFCPLANRPLLCDPSLPPETHGARA